MNTADIHEGDILYHVHNWRASRVKVLQVDPNSCMCKVTQVWPETEDPINRYALRWDLHRSRKEAIVGMRRKMRQARQWIEILRREKDE